MNGNPKIGQRARLSRIRVGQYIQFDGSNKTIYKMVESYNSIPENETKAVLLYRNGVTEEWTNKAWLGKTRDDFRNSEVTVVAKPKN